MEGARLATSSPTTSPSPAQQSSRGDFRHGLYGSFKGPVLAGGAGGADSLCFGVAAPMAMAGDGIGKAIGVMTVKGTDEVLGIEGEVSA